MPHTLRYIPGTPLKERKHAPCIPQYTTYADADDALERLPEQQRNFLEVVER